MGEETLFEGLLVTEPVCSNSFSGKHLIYARSELLPGSYLEFGQYIEIACRLCIYLDNSWLIVPGLTAIDTKWPSVPSIALDIDFEPLVAAIHPSIAQKGFCLLHWQAKPKRTAETPGRQWGCWYGGNYYSARLIEDIRSSFSLSVDLDESVVTTIPVSVLCFQGLRPVYNDKGGERKLSLVKI